MKPSSFSVSQTNHGKIMSSRLGIFFSIPFDRFPFYHIHFSLRNVSSKTPLERSLFLDILTGDSLFAFPETSSGKFFSRESVILFYRYLPFRWHDIIPSASRRHPEGMFTETIMPAEIIWMRDDSSVAEWDEIVRYLEGVISRIK